MIDLFFGGVRWCGAETSYRAGEYRIQPIRMDGPRQLLARFYHALLRGEVFQRPETLRTMMSVPATNAQSPGGAYAMGLQRRMIGGQECWGHTGFWGTAVYHCAGPDVTIVRHTNQAQPAESFIYRTLFDRIAQGLRMGG